MLEITGKFIKDANFTRIFTDDTMYVIPRNASANWSYCRVGQVMANGGILTAETFQKWKTECTEEGTFDLIEEDDED